ncbi:16S rRNA (guanine(966)-N(2))-methyltransferase RsmD [Salibacterium halotolerans]|uniref:16S rRNA (Guanine(966)-N(2))-methyltransferase RsmD n=1 Tax=Salibacterium halotolerans TaxID=1884432 RepID=A0A1I5M3A1_9BACI|nr:16S rRNA (guanine(966)-N(2))-methyltransferase RsmD [Salibacterium halotolerans]SFP03970.1 16S rRNA (guanine(966)-N(2))-methyltransferase RsmD [Salibacterium halotolerans]
MRVISGKYKGKPLRAVQGMKTRPTSDKVKEAVFQLIGPYFEEGAVLDLYAGTGGLGIEALSRGLDQAVFVDKHSQAVKVIKQNLHEAGVDEQTEVFRSEAKRALTALTKRQRSFDYIFMDPPYADDSIPGLLSIISEEKLLRPSGIIICEHAAGAELPARIIRLEQQAVRRYGDTSISIYRTAE